MKNSKVIIAIIVLAVILVGAYVILMNNKAANTAAINTVNTTTPPTDKTNASDTTPPISTPVNIAISNFAFSPATVTIAKGTMITWTNNDNVTHNVKFADSTITSSPDLTTGQTYSFSFLNAGTYTYSCGIHPNMTGTIIVQ